MKILKRYFYFKNWKASRMESINIDLSNKSIYQVEKDVFWAEENDYGIEMIDLKHNSIGELPFGFFPNTTFRMTKYLDLSHNNLTTLNKDIFENLTAIEDLILVGNKLKELSDGIFANNPLEVSRIQYFR